MQIITDDDTCRSKILHVHKQAFGKEKGDVISALVNDLLEDESARPLYSFAAVENEDVIGHILFTRVIVHGADDHLSAQILAPLAVLPECQSKGIGSQLIQTGLAELRKAGVKVVFVLGHPGYYQKCGFTPAGKLGFEAPYTIPEEHAEAWMVQELQPGTLNTEKGRVQCASSLNRPEHWRE
ncbi:MAG: GNAT family N-acetyltransferase [Desulforhopalus sp.]